MALRPNRLEPLLDAQGFVVLDGGLATELERGGADLRDPLWSARMLLDGPERILQAHWRYFEAGADIATTASYQASLAGFRTRGLSASEARAAIRRSVELAREAALRAEEHGVFGKRAAAGLVAGSVGPYGAALADGSEYRGDYAIGRQELIDFHQPRLEELIAAGADLLAVETIPSLEEAVTLARLLPAWPAITAWISFSCRDGERISDGTPLVEAVAEVARGSQVIAVGVNCVPPSAVERLLARACTGTGKPLVAYPHRGERWDATARIWSGAPEPADFRRAVPRWYDLGARVIGGCCRTTPELIRELRAALTRHHGSAMTPSTSDSPTPRV